MTKFPLRQIFFLHCHRRRSMVRLIPLLKRVFFCPKIQRKAPSCIFPAARLPNFLLRFRRGRRPRRPVRFSSKGRDISRSGATSFCPRRQKDAKTPPKAHGLWNSFRPLAITAQKGPTTNRLYFYPRCRSHAPRGWRAMTGSGTRR